MEDGERRYGGIARGMIRKRQRKGEGSGGGGVLGQGTWRVSVGV